MRRVHVFEGPLRGGPMNSVIDALVLEEAEVKSVQAMRSALEAIRDAPADATKESLIAIARVALHER